MTGPPEQAPARPATPGTVGGRRAGALAGLVAGGVAFGVAELAAALTGGEGSPLIAVGSAVIDAAPQWLKQFAISAFGQHDKTVLLCGMVVVVALLAAGMGVVAVRRPLPPVIAILALGVVGAVAAATRPDAGALAIVPSVLGAVAGAWALASLAGAARLAGPPGPVTGAGGPGAPAGAGMDRRRFLNRALAFGGVAVVSGVTGRLLLGGRVDVQASRAAVRLPAPATSARPLPAGTALQVPGLSPFYTPNKDFYRVDTNLIVPRVAAETWRLRVHGMVDRELELDFKTLLARPMIERDITIACVSNEIGGPYIGNARWLGAPLAPLLREAGVHPGADQIASTAVDGFTISTPTALVLDGRDAMLAVAMNGEPLPARHGFPVRMIVPGLYGYVSATKWVVNLELTTYEQFDAYWTERGWAQMGPIKVSSRIDTPRSEARLKAGKVAVAGVAWSQHKGIDRVEVRVDKGAWRPARLSTEDSTDTWRQWVLAWDATPGRHTIQVRATDRSGTTQPELRLPPFPSGATGWHTVAVTVED